MINLSVRKSDGFVFKNSTFDTPRGVTVEVHDRYKSGESLRGHNKIVHLADDSPLKRAGIDAFVYGTDVDNYVKTKDGKPLSSTKTSIVPIDYYERPIKARCELVVIDKKGQELARGKKQIKELIKLIKKNGLKKI